MPITPVDTYINTWTTGWSSFEPFTLGGEQYYLAYKIGTGEVAIDHVRADGSGVDGVFQGTWTTGWSSFMPFVLGGEPHSLAYKVDSGDVSFDRILPGAQGVETRWSNTWTTGWTTFMPVTIGGEPGYLAYKIGTGQVAIERIRSDMTGVDTLYGATWSTGWSSFVPFLLNGQTHYIAYSADSGVAAIDRISDDGTGVTNVATLQWTTGWTSFMPFLLGGDAHYLGHKAETGQMTIDRIRGDASGSDGVTSATWANDWTSFVPLTLNGNPGYLVYKIGSGAVAIGSFRQSTADKVRSSNIQVGGKHFVDWFNGDFLPTQKGTHPTIVMYGHPAAKYPAAVNKANFNTVFDACAQFWAAEMTINQFLTFFCIMDNETGGSFLPIAERGSEKYMFESTAAGKASYNGPPNRPAGDLLRARGAISSDDDVAAWNSTTTYPDPQDDTLKAAARECDFYKFRGHGLVQLTWRRAYLSIVDPLLTANGYKTSDNLSEAELGNIIRSDPKIYIPMTKGVFAALASQIAHADDTPPDWRPAGKGIGGSSTYGELLHWRCQTLLDAMTAAGYSCS